jgi:DNA-binding response OmpR family regulator
MKDIKILLVDDEVDFVSSISDLLDLRDLRSYTALSGEEALLFVGENIPDIIVLDLRMPGLDGMDVLRRVKQHYPAIQVIILTGHGNDLDEAEARELGAFDYLTKPVDIEVLAERIRAAAYAKIALDSMPSADRTEAGKNVKE